MTSPTESAISMSIVTLPLRAGSFSSCSTDSTGPVTSSFQAMPVMPDCQGSEYSRFGSNGGLACASIRLEMFGIRSLSSFSAQPLLIMRPGKRELSVRTMMSLSIPRPCESGPWIFPKYWALSLMSSVYWTVMPVFALNSSRVGYFFVASS